MTSTSFSGAAPIAITAWAGTERRGDPKPLPGGEAKGPGGSGGVVTYHGLSFPQNSVTADFGTVGGGIKNGSAGYAATVGGGAVNTSSGSYATVGGGNVNSSSGLYATVSGGSDNSSSGELATV